jgi:hypothetical protein
VGEKEKRAIKEPRKHQKEDKRGTREAGMPNNENAKRKGARETEREKKNVQ